MHSYEKDSKKPNLNCTCTAFHSVTRMLQIISCKKLWIILCSPSGTKLVKSIALSTTCCFYQTHELVLVFSTEDSKCVKPVFSHVPLIFTKYHPYLVLFFPTIAIKHFHKSFFQRLIKVTIHLMNQATDICHTSHISKL